MLYSCPHMAIVGVKGLMLWQEQESSLSTREWLIEITEVLADKVDVVLANPDLEWATETFTCQLCIKVGVTVLLLLLIHSTQINNCNKQYQQHAAKSTDALHLMQSVMDFWTCEPCNSFLFCFIGNEKNTTYRYVLQKMEWLYNRACQVALKYEKMQWL